MKKIKSLKKQEFNPKNKNHRVQLFNQNFMKHNIASRMFTLQKEAINLTTQTLAVGLDPTVKNLLNLAEAIGDVETMIEVAKLSIPKLQEASANIKQGKLVNLHNRTKEEQDKNPDKPTPKHEQPNETDKQAAEAIKEFSKAVPDKKGFLHFFRYLRKYFNK